MQQTIGEIVRKSENDYINGTVQQSKYVQHSLLNTLERIDAYLNSKHISGETDSLGREKPFFNIVIALANVWYRATDIDRSYIKLRAIKSKDWIDSFLATIHLRDWMRRENFGTFLNEWGRILSRYGSAVVKLVESDGQLHISVIPWSRLMVDAIDFDSNPKIEVIELTEAQIKERVLTHGYNKDQVDELIKTGCEVRETANKQKKDTKSHYFRLYEIHGNFSLSHITGKEKDEDIFTQQMHVVSFLTIKKGRQTEYKDFTLYSGKEAKDPYMITHLIKLDDRTLSIGAVEYAFDAQWMVNHTQKAIKDSLDIASRLIFQTSDSRFLGKNVLSNIEAGDILIHSTNQPLTPLNNQVVNTASLQNFSSQWKSLGSEVNSVSEGMLGETPKSGTAWRQTQAILQESHSLFELMTENKALHLEDIMRKWILPYLKTKMDTSKEVSATLSQYEIDKIDSIYIKNVSLKQADNQLKNMVLSGQAILPGQKEQLLAQNQQEIQDSLSNFGNQRFFKPDNLTDKTWKEQFKDLEWEVDIDITNESFDVRGAMDTLSTVLQLTLNPNFGQNKKAQAIVGKVLELTGTMSPLEYNALSEMSVPQTVSQPQSNNMIPNIKLPSGSTGSPLPASQ